MPVQKPLLCAKVQIFCTKRKVDIKSSFHMFFVYKTIGPTTLTVQNYLEPYEQSNVLHSSQHGKCIFDLVISYVIGIPF